MYELRINIRSDFLRFSSLLALFFFCQHKTITKNKGSSFGHRKQQQHISILIKKLKCNLQLQFVKLLIPIQLKPQHILRIWISHQFDTLTIYFLTRLPPLGLTVNNLFPFFFFNKNFVFFFVICINLYSKNFRLSSSRFCLSGKSIFTVHILYNLKSYLDSI